MERITGTVGETVIVEPNYRPDPTMQLPIDKLLNKSFDTLIRVQQGTDKIPDIPTTNLFLGDPAKNRKTVPLKNSAHSTAAP